MGKRKHGTKKALEGMSGGILLIGIGILFLIDDLDFWPWILVVLGVASVPSSIAEDGFWAGIQGFVWLGGLALLFATDTIWPGILILAGLSIIGGALVRPKMIRRA